MAGPVLLISIDGLRPDAIDGASMDALRGHLARGAWTLEARTVMPSVTLPCHTSMFRGVDVPRHGITSNVFTPLARPVPSFVDLAKRAVRRTGFFYNWGELRDLCDPGSLDVSVFYQDAHRPEGDTRVTEAALAALGGLDFAFVYLGHTDEAGHRHGWMSDGYLDAAAHADRCVARILDAVGGDATVLIQSDHGGHERSHGTEMVEDMTIPWMIAGPDIPPGPLARPVRIYDTAPTLAARLGVPPHEAWDGVDVLA